MTVTLLSSNSVAYSALATGGPVTCTVAAGTQWGYLIFSVGQKETTGSGAITCSDPSVVKLAEKLTTFGTAGADTGPTRMAVFSKQLTGEETSLTYTFSGSNDVMWAWGHNFTSDYIADWDIVAVVSEDVTAGAAWSTVFPAVSFAPGDYCVVGATIPTDVTTPSQFTAETITAAGITFSAFTETGEPDSSLGNDIGGFIFRGSVSAGTATVAPTVTATAAGTVTNVYGPSILIRIRNAERDVSRSAGTYIYENTGAIDITNIDAIRIDGTFIYENTSAFDLINDMLTRIDGTYIYENTNAWQVNGRRYLDGWSIRQDLRGGFYEFIPIDGEGGTPIYIQIIP